MKLHGYIEIADDLGFEFRKYCKEHGIEYRSVDDDGLYRVSGRVLSIMKLSYRMTKLHDEYFKKIEA